MIDGATRYYACPECFGASYDQAAYEREHGITGRIPCPRCNDSGSLPESKLTAEEVIDADRARAEDDRWRNKFDYAWE